MSFLDMDERLLEIAARADIVYSPLIDIKEYPEDVDVCLVEGACRQRGRTCARSAESASGRGRSSPSATARSPPTSRHAQPDRCRNPSSQRAYIENVTLNARIPSEVVPPLLPMALPVHAVVEVDVFLPGLPAVGRPDLPALVRPARGADAGRRTGARFGR